jgi:hypothetical protein
VIAQVLNRPFLLAVLDEMEPYLEVAIEGPPSRGGGGPHPADKVTLEDWRVTLEEVRRTKADWRGDRSVPAPSPVESAAEPPMPLEDFAFLPRDPVLSVLQSALEEFLESEHEDAIVEEPLVDPARRGAGVPMVTNRYLAGIPPPDEMPEGRRWLGGWEVAKPLIFSDPRWLGAGLAMGLRRIRGTHAFNEIPAEWDELAPNARLVICADWATGIPRALAVRDRMRAAIDTALGERRQVHVLHLGDVYPSGFKRDYNKRFLGPWPVARGGEQQVFSWVLNGNHDMYSGGRAYFKTCLADPRFEQQAGSSWFRLTNADWQFVGLDTAWSDEGLQAPQGEQTEAWAADRSRKLVLLSHHQPFSAYGRGCPGLVRELGGVLEPYDRNPVTAWFWGHEHNCVGYSSHMGVRCGRLIGNGGVPEYMMRSPSDPVAVPALWEFRKQKRRLGQPWGVFGFAIADLDGPRMMLTYVDEEGESMHEPETIG